MILYIIHIYFNNRVRATCSIYAVWSASAAFFSCCSLRAVEFVFFLAQSFLYYTQIILYAVHVYYNPQRAPDDTQRFSRNSSNVIPFLGIDIIIYWSYYFLSSCCARLIPTPPPHHHHYCSPIDYTTLTPIVSTFCYCITNERTAVESIILTLHCIGTPPEYIVFV